jgi:aspartate aminotransferase
MGVSSVPSLSSMAMGLEGSGIRRIMNIAMGMPEVVRLEVGEPLFPTPRHIVEGACEAAAAGFTRYTPTGGIPSLRNAIAAWVGGAYGVELKPANVCLTVGAVGALAGAIQAVTNPGDHVLVPDPGWPNYLTTCLCAGAVPVRYPLAERLGFMPDMEALEALVGPSTKALLVNSPSNPLGIVFPRSVMEALVDFARRHGLFLLSDEVYEYMVYEGSHTSALPLDTDDRVIIASGFSKTYAMTGWRIGYAIAPEPVVDLIGRLQEGSISCVSGVAQKAAEAALSGPQDCVGIMRETYRDHLLVAKAVLDEAGIPYLQPQGAFYLWVNVACDDSDAFTEEFLRRHRVSVAPGATFGPSGRSYIRVSLASRREDIEEGLRRLAEFMGSRPA